MENNIPIVNPLWVDDKLHGIFNIDGYGFQRIYYITEVFLCNHSSHNLISPISSGCFLCFSWRKHRNQFYRSIGWIKRL